MTEKTDKISSTIQDMLKVGAHFGFLRSRRNPSFKSLVCGVKNMTEIIDLEKTEQMLASAEAFVADLASKKKTILFVSSKSEARDVIQRYAESINMPFVASRWIGGTLSNFVEIKKRVHLLADLINKKEKGELLKYTKKERLMFDREIDNLTAMFSGLRSMDKMPDALFIVDSKKESIAIAEAKKTKIPVIALASTDCDLSSVDYAIPANDASKASIDYFVARIAEAYKKAAISA